MFEQQIQLPEADLLTNLIRQVKSCRSGCNEILEGSIHLKVALQNILFPKGC